MSAAVVAGLLGPAAEQEHRRQLREPPAPRLGPARGRHHARPRVDRAGRVSAGSAVKRKRLQLAWLRGSRSRLSVGICSPLCAFRRCRSRTSRASPVGGAGALRGDPDRSRCSRRTTSSRPSASSKPWARTATTCSRSASRGRSARRSFFCKDGVSWAQLSVPTEETKALVAKLPAASRSARHHHRDRDPRAAAGRGRGAGGAVEADGGAAPRGGRRRARRGGGDRAGARSRSPRGRRRHPTFSGPRRRRDERRPHVLINQPKAKNVLADARTRRRLPRDRRLARAEGRARDAQRPRHRLRHRAQPLPRRRRLLQAARRRGATCTAATARTPTSPSCCRRER